MKQPLRILGTVVMITLLLAAAGCAPAAPPAPAEPAKSGAVTQPTTQPAAQLAASAAAQSAAAKPVVFTLATDTDLEPGLDIHDALSFQTGQSLGMQVFDTLVQLTAKGYEPRLAETWEAAADGWVFHLRKGVKFHDGTPFNADAVKANVDRLTNKDLKLRQTSKWASVARAEVVDEFTVKLVTSGKPSLTLFGQLVHAAGGAMQSPKALQEKKYPIGTGPYKFVDWKKNEQLVLEKNPDYWMGAPAVDRVIIKVVPDPAARTLMLESGEADFIMYVAPVDAQRLSTSKGYTVLSPANPGWRYIGLNTQKKPFDDKRVRQALNYAIDKEGISKSIFFGYARVLTSPLGSGMWGHSKVGPYPYDPAKAKQLLAEAGFPNGFKATMITAKDRPAEALSVAQAVQANLKAVGVELEISVLEWATQLETMYTPLEKSTVQMFSASYGGADPDTLRLEAGCKEFPPNRNASFYCNQKVDDLFQSAMYETDQTQRAALYQQVQQTVWDDAPWIFLTELTWIGSYSDKVQGFTMYEGNQNYYDLRFIKKAK